MKIQESMQVKLQERFHPIHLEVENESSRHRKNPNGETHFRVLVVSEEFSKLSRLARHQAVQSLFDEERKKGLHALTITCWTPEEWEKEGRSQGHESPSCMTTPKKKVAL